MAYITVNNVEFEVFKNINVHPFEPYVLYRPTTKVHHQTLKAIQRKYFSDCVIERGDLVDYRDEAIFWANVRTAPTTERKMILLLKGK